MAMVTGAHHRETDVADPKYVALVQRGDLYEVMLLDSEKRPTGHGYRGPTQRRAEQDLKYWMRSKGLEKVEDLGS